MSQKLMSQISRLSLQSPHNNEQMKEQYVLKRQVSVDETMIPFKGKVAFKQYMPAKPSKWGIQMLTLAGS